MPRRARGGSTTSHLPFEYPCRGPWKEGRGAPIEIEGFDDAALRILDGAIDEVRIEVDELGRQIRDERLESEPILERRSQRIVGLRHDR